MVGWLFVYAGWLVVFVCACWLGVFVYAGWLVGCVYAGWLFVCVYAGWLVGCVYAGWSTGCRVALRSPRLRGGLCICIVEGPVLLTKRLYVLKLHFSVHATQMAEDFHDLFDQPENE